jgi:hypothetical protein
LSQLNVAAVEISIQNEPHVNMWWLCGVSARHIGEGVEPWDSHSFCGS